MRPGCGPFHVTAYYGCSMPSSSFWPRSRNQAATAAARSTADPTPAAERIPSTNASRAAARARLAGGQGGRRFGGPASSDSWAPTRHRRGCPRRPAPHLDASRPAKWRCEGGAAEPGCSGDLVHGGGRFVDQQGGGAAQHLLTVESHETSLSHMRHDCLIREVRRSKGVYAVCRRFAARSLASVQRRGGLAEAAGSAGGEPTPCHSQRIAHGGACRKAPHMPQNRRPDFRPHEHSTTERTP
ncbi:hypothetical protein SCYAM73S_06264 [Streptomyces cyaneofuscatus]